MSGLVVDASVVVAWLFDDEDEPRADRVLDRLVEEGALAPQLWHLLSITDAKYSFGRLIPSPTPWWSRLPGMGGRLSWCSRWRNTSV